MREKIEIMSVLRKPPLGKLAIKIGDQEVEKVAEIASAPLRQRLLAAIGDMVAFAGGYQVLVDAGFAPPLPATGQHSRGGENEADVLTPTQARFLADMEAQRDALKTQSQQGKSNPSLFRGLVPPLAEAKAPAQARNGRSTQADIFHQIDAILQKHVARELALSQRSIHLVQSPAGSLCIEVDGRIYDRPSDVTEPAVKYVISMALKEWESS